MVAPCAYSFIPLVENMIAWAKTHMVEIIDDREKAISSE